MKVVDDSLFGKVGSWYMFVIDLLSEVFAQKTVDVAA